MTAPLAPWAASAPPTAPGEPIGSVELTVEIGPAPVAGTCLGCATEQPPALPVTGGEPVSLLLPMALVIAGVAAMLWARRPARG